MNFKKVGFTQLCHWYFGVGINMQQMHVHVVGEAGRAANDNVFVSIATTAHGLHIVILCGNYAATTPVHSMAEAACRWLERVHTVLASAIRWPVSARR